MIRQRFSLQLRLHHTQRIDAGFCRGIGGGVIAQDLFMKKYGLKNPDGTTNQSRKDHVSAVIVSLLQAGAFFGALTSAPVSGKSAELSRPSNYNLCIDTRTARLGRKKTLLAFCVIFSIGAVSNLMAIPFILG